MIDKSAIDDVLFAAHVAALAKVFANLDVERIVRIVNSGMLKSSLGGTRDVVGKLEMLLQVAAFAVTELKKVCPTTDEIDGASAKHYDALMKLPNGKELNQRVEDLMSSLKKTMEERDANSRKRE